MLWFKILFHDFSKFRNSINIQFSCVGVQEAFSWIAWCSILLKYWRSPGSDCTHDLKRDSPSTIHTYIVCTVGSEWCDVPISWNEKDKEFLLKMGLIWVNVFIGELLWLIFNIMRYSFDTVRVNTRVRGDNISLSTLHGLLVVPSVKDFPKLSSWFNIHLAPVNTPVITDICTCSVTLGFPSILIPVYLLNIYIYLSMSLVETWYIYVCI